MPGEGKLCSVNPKGGKCHNRQRTKIMSEEKQVESSEADESQEAKIYTEEQFKGLLADKQAEVKKRQELEHTGPVKE